MCCKQFVEKPWKPIPVVITTCLVGECDDKQALRRNTLLYCISYSCRHHACLPTAEKSQGHAMVMRQSWEKTSVIPVK